MPWKINYSKGEFSVITPARVATALKHRYTRWKSAPRAPTGWVFHLRWGVPLLLFALELTLFFFELRDEDNKRLLWIILAAILVVLEVCFEFYLKFERRAKKFWKEYAIPGIVGDFVQAFNKVWTMCEITTTTLNIAAIMVHIISDSVYERFFSTVALITSFLSFIFHSIAAVYEYYQMVIVLREHRIRQEPIQEQSLEMSAKVTKDLLAKNFHRLWSEYSEYFLGLCSENSNVRLQSVTDLASVLHENPENIEGALSGLFSLYTGLYGEVTGVSVKEEGREAIALALHSVADLVGTRYLHFVMNFLLSQTLVDLKADVRNKMIKAGVQIIKEHGKDNVSMLLSIFDIYLKKTASEFDFDLVCDGVSCFIEALSSCFVKGDSKVFDIVEKFLDLLNAPSLAVRDAVAGCLSELMPSVKVHAPVIVSRLFDKLKSERSLDCVPAAFGLAVVVDGFGISSLEEYGILSKLKELLSDRHNATHRAGALLAFSELCQRLRKSFELFAIGQSQLVFSYLHDQDTNVRKAAKLAAMEMVTIFSERSIKSVLTELLEDLKDEQYQKKRRTILHLGLMAYCAPDIMFQHLPDLIPIFRENLRHPQHEVCSACLIALNQVALTMKNPELYALRDIILGAMKTEKGNELLLGIIQMDFAHPVDAYSFSLLSYLVHEWLRSSSDETKNKAVMIAMNMCASVAEPRFKIPYLKLLLPELQKVLLNSNLEIQSVAARAIRAVISDIGTENFPSLGEWLLEKLNCNESNERCGAAQSLSELFSVATAGVIAPFEELLPCIIQHCYDESAAVRDGYLTLLKYLPKSVDIKFESHLKSVLPPILHCLADQIEGVRGSALSAGFVLVDHYCTTSLGVFLTEFMNAVFKEDWQIRLGSLQLLKYLMFKAANISGEALLKGISATVVSHKLIDAVGEKNHDEILAILYMVLGDPHPRVCYAASQVWTAIVAKNAETLEKIMSVLVRTLVISLGCSGRQEVARRALRKLGVDPEKNWLRTMIVPFSQELMSGDALRRSNVCVALHEVMASAGGIRLSYLVNTLIPLIQKALCDSVEEVCESGVTAFMTLYKNVGKEAVQGIVSELDMFEENKMAYPATSSWEITLSKPLSRILHELVKLPLSAHALGDLVMVALPKLNQHLSKFFLALISSMGDDSLEVQNLAKKAAETVVAFVEAAFYHYYDSEQ